jgi:hypothetical protein
MPKAADSVISLSPCSGEVVVATGMSPAGVDVGAGGLGARDGRIDKVLRRDFAAMYQLCQAGCIVFPQHPFGRHRFPLLMRG